MIRHLASHYGVGAQGVGRGGCLLRQEAGLAVADLVRSLWVYDRLRRFRASIESGISLLKSVFGLARCVWKRAVAFHAYVRTAVLAANLLCKDIQIRVFFYISCSWPATASPNADCGTTRIARGAHLAGRAILAVATILAPNGCGVPHRGRGSDPGYGAALQPISRAQHR